MAKKTRRTRGPIVHDTSQAQRADLMQLKTPKYTTFQVADALHIPRNTFKDMQARGFIPVTKESEGRGMPALLSEIDACSIALQRRFSTHGIRREIAAKHSDEVRKELLKGENSDSIVLFEAGHKLRAMGFGPVTEEDMPQFWLVDLTHGMIKVYLEGHGFKGIEEFDPDWQILLAVNFRALQREVHDALAAF